MVLSQSQQRSLAIIPKVSAFPSVLGSLYIVYDFARDAKKRKLTHHRLVFGMSLIDFLTSTFFFLSTWPAPHSSGLFLASGSDQTCEAQGFILTLAIGVPFYNLGLIAYSYLLACATDKRFDASVRRIEPILHAVPWAAGLGVSTSGLVLDLYRPAGLWCWIDDSFDEFRIYVVFIPILLCISTSIVIMGLMYRAVRKQEIRIAKYSKDCVPAQRKLSRKVVKQAYLYTAAFLFTWIFATITRFIQWFNKDRPIPFPLLVLFALTLPAQGFFNFLVYNRRQYIKYWKNHPDRSLGLFLQRFLRRQNCYCCGCCSGRDIAPTILVGNIRDEGEENPCDALRSMRELKCRRVHSKTEMVDDMSASQIQPMS